MYKEYKNLNLPEIDTQIRKQWEANGVFEKSIEQRPKEDSFVFYEGPPSANGKPGIHHVMARTIKDLYCRYHTMKGKRVERKGGWDTHGLPVELQVEKRLGITKEDIGKTISVKEYNAACRQDVLKFKDMWDDLTVKMGYWVDLNGDGRKDFITARSNAKKGHGELVWLEHPEDGLDSTDSWSEHVLGNLADVSFDLQVLPEY